MSTDGDPADDDDAALEGERYQGVRGLFRQAREDGFDEEPSPRIDALLMAAARARAEQKVGAFERLRRWLASTMMQPAVAGAVMVAVIGGTAGVLYMKGKGRVVEPNVSSTTGTAAPPAEPPRTPIDLPSAEKQKEMESAANAEALQATLREREELRQRESEQMAVEHARPKGEGPKLTGGGGGGGRGGDGVGSGPGGGESGGDQIKDPFANQDDRTLDYKPDGRNTATVIATDEGHGTGNGGMIGGVTTRMGTSGTATESPPPPDTTGTGAAIAESDDVTKNVTSVPESTTVRSDKPPPPSKRTQAENLHKQARSAAKKKNCETVKTMAKRAKQLDAAYYRDTFSRDAALKDCL